MSLGWRPVVCMMELLGGGEGMAGFGGFAVDTRLENIRFMMMLCALALNPQDLMSNAEKGRGGRQTQMWRIGRDRARQGAFRLTAVFRIR